MSTLTYTIDWCFLAFAIYRFLWISRTWDRSLCVVQARHLPTQLKLLRHTRSGIASISIAIFFIIGTPLIVYSMQWHDRVVLVPAGVLMGFSIIAVLLQPPVILILGVSSPQVRELAHVLNATAVPFRVVSLFAYECMRYGLWRPELISRDNLRTFGSNIWKDVVKSLAGIASVIIVDTRTPSEQLSEEILMLLSNPRLRQKSLFFCEPRGTAPALVAAGIDQSSRTYDSLIIASDQQQLTAMIMIILSQKWSELR